MRMRRLFLGLLLCAGPSAFAADFYVDPVNGSDTTGNGSSASPWRTLQTVIDNRIETRDWNSLPYTASSVLVTVNAGAPVKAGDTIWLRNGYHGAILIQGAYNLAPVIIAAQSGHTPRLRTLTVRAAQNWVLRGLSISPSHAPPLAQTTIVDVDDHNFFGPAWDIELHDSDVFTVADASAWTANDWVNVASSGVDVGASRVTVRSCRVRNVRFGISVGGAAARIQENLIDGFSADGMRGLGNDGLFEYNRVQNNYVEDPPDANHDDGFQSWSVGPGGVGTGEVRGVVLRGNVFINHVDPSHPLRSSMQAIGCFDGWFVDWVVENNVVITDHWHGITFLGMRDSRIVNNTVIDLDAVSPGPPWIMVNPHKNGQPSQNVVVRNNLATDYALAGTNVVGDHNLEFTMAGANALFLAPPFDLHLRPATAAVDTGSPTLAPPLDVEKKARPQGAGFDLGAYERFVPSVGIDDVAVVEGTGGTVNAVFTVSLSGASAQAVTMGFQTANGTATAGSDFTAASGSLTFTAGQVSRSVSVAVLGDAAIEADETFSVGLSSIVNATAGDVQGVATIVDDDAPSLTRLELGHGSVQWGDLAADPGPIPDADLYRLAQAPRASYEVVVDGASGDLGPGLLVERLASDNVSVVQSGTATGTGSSVSLRWENTVAATVSGQHIRVRSGGCTVACGADDVYRIRAYETTYTIPRFNNSATQATVVLLQNPTTQAVSGRLHFWDGAGALLYTHPFVVPARGLFQLNAATVSVLQGRSGSITVPNDARYGALAGKAVALEAATGFAFDSPMAAKAR
jgi:Calx-beta domain/Right handed beta helix region